MFILHMGISNNGSTPKNISGPANSEPQKKIEVAQQQKKTNVDEFKGQPAQNNEELTTFQEAEIGLHFSLLEKKDVKPSGIHKGDDIPADVRQKLENGEIEFKDISEELQKKILVEPKLEDILKHKGGKKLDWICNMNPDGKTYEYTLIPPHAATTRLPTGVDVKDKVQDVDPKSIKYIFYKDPETKEVKKGIYFEVSEKAGLKGKGGINGIIVSSDRYTVIFNDTRGEAYIINKPKPPAPNAKG